MASVEVRSGLTYVKQGTASMFSWKLNFSVTLDRGGHSLLSGTGGCAAQQGLVSRVRTPELSILLALHWDWVSFLLRINRKYKLVYPNLTLLRSEFAICIAILNKLV